MILLAGPPHRSPAVSLTRFISLLLILSCGLNTAAGLLTEEVEVWFTGPAALWANLTDKRDQLDKAIVKDINKHLYTIESIHFPSQSPHTASTKEGPPPKALMADGIGYDAKLKLWFTFRSKVDLRELIRETIYYELNTEFPEFGGTVRIFPFMPNETEVLVFNGTIAINQPTYLMNMYLAEESSLIPKGSVYQTTNEVLAYMPIDLQSALDPNQTSYLIMPTKLWTNESGSYVNYTVYTTPDTKKETRMTPEKIYQSLVNNTLPKFGEKMKALLASNDKLSGYQSLLYLPVTLRNYLPPNPNPPAPSNIVSSVTANFVLHFSGDSKIWKETIRTKNPGFNESILKTVKYALNRNMYDTSVQITSFEPVKNTDKKINGLLVHGEVKQDRRLNGVHPWDANEIISVISTGDYHTAISYYTGEVSTVKLLAVGLDAYFGPISTSNTTVLILIFVLFLVVTIIGLVSVLIFLQIQANKMKESRKIYDDEAYEKPILVSNPAASFCSSARTGSQKIYDDEAYETPILVENPATSFCSSARTNSSLHLETIDERQIPVIVGNPLRTTENTTCEMNSYAADPRGVF